MAKPVTWSLRQQDSAFGHSFSSTVIGTSRSDPDRPNAATLFDIACGSATTCILALRLLDGAHLHQRGQQSAHFCGDLDLRDRIDL